MIVKFYISKMIEFELFVVMVGGFVFIVGFVMVGYVGMGVLLIYLIVVLFMVVLVGLLFVKILVL